MLHKIYGYKVLKKGGKASIKSAITTDLLLFKPLISFMPSVIYHMHSGDRRDVKLCYTYTQEDTSTSAKTVITQTDG